MNKRRSFFKDQRGIAWVWGVGLICIVLVPFVYLPMSLIWDNVAALILGVYTFQGTTAFAIVFAKLVMSYLAVFSLIYTAVWMWVNSKARAIGE